MRLAVGEVDALATIAVAWFDGVDQSGADPVLAESIGYLLDVIARSAATAASKVDSVHAAIADAQPVRSGEAFDYSDGTSPGGQVAVSTEDLAIVRRIRELCPDGRSDAELLELFKRNKRVLSRSDEDVIAAMTRPR